MIGVILDTSPLCRIPSYVGFSTFQQETYWFKDCLHTCFNLNDLCVAEPNEDEKEAEMDDTHDNKKALRQNDAHTAESKLDETQTVTMKPAELREYNLFISRTWKYMTFSS